MKKFICIAAVLGLMCALEPTSRTAEASQGPQVWTWSGMKVEKEGEARTAFPSRLDVVLSQRLVINWDGWAVEPESVKDQGNGRIEWQGSRGPQWYLVRMSISDDYQRVQIDYEVLSGRGGHLLYRGRADLTKVMR